MSSYDRKKHLEALHAERKANTRNKVDEAIQRLIRANKNINFNSVAEESGLTKATLYSNKDIREIIETLRHQQAQVPTPAQIKISYADIYKKI